MTDSLTDFTVIKKLGDGAYSSVYKVRRNADNQIYALKQVKMLQLTEKEKENALNEVRILASVDDPNVILVPTTRCAASSRLHLQVIFA